VRRNPLRILYLAYGSQSGVTAAVVERLTAAGHEVHVANPVKGFLYKRRVAGVQLPNATPGPVLATAAAMLRFRQRWRELYLHTCAAFDLLTARSAALVRRVRPDLVLQSGALFGPGAPEVPYYLYVDHTRAISEAYSRADGLGPPIPYEEAWRRRERDVYRRAAAIFSMSEHARRSLVEDYGVPAARVHVVGAGPNVRPGGGALPDEREPAFLFVGKHFEVKGGREALAAFEEARAAHPGAQLWMVGRDQPATAPPGVTLLGPRTPDEVAWLYERASAFVLPSVREPFGLAFLEAMAFGLPCIGTCVEAIPEIIEDGVTGLVVPPRDAGAVARAMRTLLDDPVCARRMGAAGHARLAERYGWQRAVERMLDVVAGTLAERTAEVAPRYGDAFLRMVPKSPAT
jgi:alpha-maltose-1-phosphate synthase